MLLLKKYNNLFMYVNLEKFFFLIKAKIKNNNFPYAL